MDKLYYLFAQYEVKLGPNVPQTTADDVTISSILTVVFSVLGALSILMFTVGGLRYISSQGDPQAAAKAKGTLIYALVGLLVSILAVAIVTFVLGNV